MVRRVDDLSLANVSGIYVRVTKELGVPIGNTRRWMKRKRDIIVRCAGLQEASLVVGVKARRILGRRKRF